MKKLASEIDPGEYYCGVRVESVDVGYISTMIETKTGIIVLDNNAKVWVDGPPLEKSELRDAFGQVGGL